MTYSIRYITLVVALLCVGGVLLWRIISLQVFEQDFLRDQGKARTVRVVNTPAYRGMMTDRNGEPLAISTPVYSVWLNPKEFDVDHPQVLELALVLDLALGHIVDKAHQNSNREFLYLQRHVTPMVAAQVRKLCIPGIYLKSEYRRYYPMGEVAAHVVGFTDIDDRGQEGLELALDSWLRGVAGTKRVVRDRMGREVQILQGLQEMRSGQDVALSLDQRLQYLAYRELKAAVTKHKAMAGSVVVLDIHTGEILAMVNQPSFNPNLRIKIQGDGRYRNRAVTDTFEPGSVMKTFSVASALQHGVATPKTLIDTSPGWMQVAGHVVREDKNKNFGRITVATVLQKSSNIGVSKLTLSLPADCLWKTYAQFGFGTTTGSGFPGESQGFLVKPPKHSAFVLATMAFGYGISVTPLQLAQAYAILGADGLKRPVTFLKQATISQGVSVMDPAVARQLVDMLIGIVESGSGVKARVEGYRTAGKTGTARKVAVGGYQVDSHVATFAGLVPASHPRFAIVVMMDDPKGDLYYGSQVAAPLFAHVAAGALRVFNIAPDAMDTPDLRVAQFQKGASHNE